MASPPVIQDPAQASRRAKIRIGVAVALLVTAIGILAMLNQRKNAPEPPPEEESQVTQESISSQEAERPAAPEAPNASEISPPPPVSTDPASVSAPVPPPPPVPGKLPVPAAQPTKIPQTIAPPAEETGMSKPTTVSNFPAESGPTKSKSAALPPPLTSEKPTTPKAFEVQLGVFSDMENAKQLQAKLAEHGIPSHTETRVQVGPFKTRAEAEQARAKLKTLGISAVIAAQ